MRRSLRSKKVLVASLGVASVSYVACSKEPAPPPEPVGNLMPVQQMDAAPPTPPEPTAVPPPVVGNLMPPPMPMPDAAAKPKKGP